MTAGLAGQRVVVVGAGRSGTAAARLALAKGAEVTLTDARAREQLPTAGELPAVRLELGGHREATFTGADLIVLSPGVPPTLPALVAAVARGVPVTGEIELAARYIEAPIVAITGTNGKSTVTSLAGAIAAASGRPTFVGGNLGTPLADAVGTEAASRHGIVVVELSSFQLETCDRFHPCAAALLNITPDHLDRYPGLAAYGDAKLRIAQRLTSDDVLVVNHDDPEVRAALLRRRAGGGRTLAYSTRAASAEVAGWVAGDQLALRFVDRRGVELDERYPVSDLQLVGRHNLGNALAAYLLLRAADLAAVAAVGAGARAFTPLPHRMQRLGERAGVRYYDDSKGTNVAAVVASLDGFPSPYVLIAGGRDKGGSYAPLAEALAAGDARAVVLIGEAAAAIAAAVTATATRAVPLRRADTLDEAVRIAAGLARPGDAVVLSPACSSFDMFTDYAHRGRAFRAAFEGL